MSSNSPTTFSEGKTLKLSIDERDRAQSMVKYGRRQDVLLGRIMLEGFESLSETEQVEFYLHHYKPKKGTDVQAIAQSLVEKYECLAEIAFLSEKELMAAEGMYPALARRFTNLGKLLLSYAKYERVYQPVYIRSIAELCKYVLPLYRVCEYPGTWQLCLNENFELIYQREIVPSRAWGEGDAVENSLQDADFACAKYVIIVQMCGREFADPKPYDKKHAKLHAERLSEMGCVLLDVVLIDEGKLTSMYELGMVKPFGKNNKNRQVYLDERKDQ